MLLADGTTDSTILSGCNIGEEQTCWGCVPWSLLRGIGVREVRIPWHGRIELSGGAGGALHFWFRLVICL